jgi:hypothetical protein
VTKSTRVMTQQRLDKLLDSRFPIETNPGSDGRAESDDLASYSASHSESIDEDVIPQRNFDKNDDEAVAELMDKLDEFS